MKICYQNFINGVMRTTGLGLDQMQTFEEWIENRQEQFKEHADKNELAAGFEVWLNKKYN